MISKQHSNERSEEDVHMLHFDGDLQALENALDETTLIIEMNAANELLRTVAAKISEVERGIKHLSLIQTNFDASSDGQYVQLALSDEEAKSLWQALPNLEALTLKGHRFFETLVLDSLKELNITGLPIWDVWDGKDLDMLESFSWEFPGDIYGVACPPTNLGWVLERMPNLKTLDISKFELDGYGFSVEDTDEYDFEFGFPEEFMRGSIIQGLRTLKTGCVSAQVITTFLPNLKRLYARELDDVAKLPQDLVFTPIN